MLLKQLFKKTLLEGGNLRLGDPEKGEPVHSADEIELKVHNRTYMVGILNKLLHDINLSFAQQYKRPLWNPELLQSQEFLGGSSLHFFNVKGISDEEFVAKKPKVGDIDTQVNKELESEVQAFLTSIVNKQVGNSIFLGFDRGNEQYNGLFQLSEPPVKIQIDFEFGRYDPKTDTPDEWFRFSHSSDWDDIQANIKGVFHKYIFRALSGISAKEMHVAKWKGAGKNKKFVVDPNPEVNNTVSFAVASAQGGGVREKYKQVVDPETGEDNIDGIPIMQEVPAKDSEYVQNLAKQFEMLFNRQPEKEDLKLQKSFIGALDLMNKYLTPEQKQQVAESFFELCFEVGGQMITRDDPRRDAETKFAAIDVMLEKLDLPKLRNKAVAAAKAYEDDYTEVEAFKKANPNERQPRAALKRMKASQQVQENAVVQSKRKGIVHLEKMKDLEFIELLDELRDETGKKFKLDNVPMTVKVDGFGSRFGKSEDGRSFYETSRAGPKFGPGNFLNYHKEKGTQDPEVLARAKLFDSLQNKIMHVIERVDNEIDLIDTKVHVEVLYSPFATVQPDGRLKFVGIAYDELPKGVELALVPLFVEVSSTGEPHPQSDEIVKSLRDMGRIGDTMFIDNSLTHNGDLDVTGMLPPLKNIEILRSMLTSGKLEQKRQAKEVLLPVKEQLAEFIINHPGIFGKDILGKDYEGIILNTQNGPVKITSPEQKKLISDKQAAIAAARPPAPASGQRSGKTAVVTAGSFVGHRGHEQLINFVLDRAKDLNADPYVYISSAVGPDDPIPPETKLSTWQKLYPAHADMFHLIQPGGTVAKKIEKELVTASNPPPYDRIIVMVGSDRYQGFSKWMAHLSKRMKNPQYPGFEHVQFDVETTPRESDAGGTGISFTQLRNILKDPDATEQQQLHVWSQGFDLKKLGKTWIKHLMDVSKQNMGIAQPPIAEGRLFNALVRHTYANESESKGIVNKIVAAGAATKKAVDAAIDSIPKPFDEKEVAKDIKQGQAAQPVAKKVPEAFKMPPESLQDKLYRKHQELRKKRGAPDPDYYKKLAQQKQKEIDDLKRDDNDK
jgi:hypothetical protein